MTDWRRMTVPANLIQIDLDPSQIGMNFPVCLGIVADARSAIEAISAAIPESRPRDGWGPIWQEARSARSGTARVADRHAASRVAR